MFLASSYGRTGVIMRTQTRLLVFLCIVLATGRAMAQSGTYSDIVKYVSPGGGSITAGPDGALWFTNGSSIGRITTAGAITEYSLPSSSGFAWQIVSGPDGALWFTDQGTNSIGSITTAGVVTEFAVPGSTPFGITTGSDGALWFTEELGNQIGRITTAGAVNEYPVTGLCCWPQYIVAGPDGALWITYAGYNLSDVLRMTTDGAFTVYGVPGLPTGLEEPQQIVAGSDGALWFAETYGWIFRLTTDGVFTQYFVPLPGNGDPTQWIAAGPDGALWFTAACNPCTTAWIGRLTPTGLFTEFALGRGSWLFGGITAGPDGGIWFTPHSVKRPGTNYIARAPACGLGLSAGYNGPSVTTTFDLGVSRPAIWSVSLQKTSGLKKPLPAVVPPRFITLNWPAGGLTGNVLVKSELSDFSGQVMCAEWTTVSTGK